MESSTSKTEMMKPLFLKAGIPLVLSIAGFIYAKIIAKRNSNSSPFESNLSSNEELENLENHFLEYQEMKEQESMLIEFKNKLELEAAHVEFLDREIASMEAENGRFLNLVVEFLRFLEKEKLDNKILKRKTKKMLKNTKEKSRIIREKNMKIDAAEQEILRLCNEVEVRCSVIKKLEDRVDELQRFIDSLQEDKNEMLMKLNAVENSTKIDAERVTKEEYNKAVKELEEAREERATEIAELIYLKLNNACLKHEVVRNHEIEEKRNHLELEFINGNREMNKMEHQENGIIATRNSGHEHSSTRKKILKKIKKWVEGNEHMKPKHEEKENQEIKCFDRLSVSDKTEEEEDHIIQARRSCSSA